MDLGREATARTANTVTINSHSSGRLLVRADTVESIICIVLSESSPSGGSGTRPISNEIEHFLDRRLHRARVGRRKLILLIFSRSETSQSIAPIHMITAYRRAFSGFSAVDVLSVS
jgi:hypothetical protein